MEKAKAYIKNELRGGSQQSIQSEPQSPTPSLSNRQPVELMPSPGAAAAAAHRAYHHPQQLSHYYAKSTGRASAPPPSVCFVCGGHGGYEPQPLRVRPYAERPGDAYFPFLERHEPPNGVSAVTAGQDYVTACMLCYRSLHEQWDSYERQKKPLLQRIYHMKRVDGKGYIGADVATQSEYAAQMLGLSAEHLTQNGLSDLQGGAGIASMDPYALSRHYSSPHHQQQLPPPSHHHQLSTSRNASPSPGDYYPRQSTTPNSYHKHLSRPPSEPLKPTATTTQLASNTAPPSPAAAASGSSPLSFAQHKFKMTPTGSPAAHLTAAGAAPYHPAQYQQLQQQTAAYHMLQQVAAGASEHNHYKGNPYTALPSPLPLALPPPPVILPSASDDNATVLDLRNSATPTSTSTAQRHPQPLPPPSQATQSQPQSEVGILDLSMPDKNSITEVCYVCGDEQRRGSLIELSTVKPKDSRHVVPYFPLFNEMHPRPARSRPKDPRGMIQACMPCYEDLMQQWNAHQVSF